MSFENPTPAPEKEPHIPSLAEIKAQIERLSGQENPEVLRTLEDEKGVYLYEVVKIDEHGDASLYSYRRSGNFQEAKTATTNIDVAHFRGALADGMCVGGSILSNYDETSGQWTEASEHESMGEPASTQPGPEESILQQQEEKIDEAKLQPTTPLAGNDEAAGKEAHDLFESLLIQEAVKSVYKTLDEAEAAFGTTDTEEILRREETNMEAAMEAREKTKPFLNKVYARLIELNKSQEQVSPLNKWNPDGGLTENQFNDLNLRRKKLSNAVGMLNKDASSGKMVIRHDLNEI